MKKPVVALVGRPNVGKSTLFNRLVGKRISIIEDTPGITRDRIYSMVNYNDYSISLLINILIHSIIATIIYTTIMYFILKKLYSFFKIKQIK